MGHDENCRVKIMTRSERIHRNARWILEASVRGASPGYRSWPETGLMLTAAWKLNERVIGRGAAVHILRGILVPRFLAELRHILVSGRKWNDQRDCYVVSIAHIENTMDDLEDK